MVQGAWFRACVRAICCRALEGQARINMQGMAPLQRPEMHDQPASALGCLHARSHAVCGVCQSLTNQGFFVPF